MSVERRSQPTIMDGEVVTFSTAFDDRQGAFGPTFRAAGVFEASASRNRVMIHRAEIQTRDELEALIDACRQAWAEHCRLRRT